MIALCHLLLLLFVIVLTILHDMSLGHTWQVFQDTTVFRSSAPAHSVVMRTHIRGSHSQTPLLMLTLEPMKKYAKMSQKTDKLEGRKKVEVVSVLVEQPLQVNEELRKTDDAKCKVCIYVQCIWATLFSAIGTCSMPLPLCLHRVQVLTGVTFMRHIPYGSSFLWYA